MPATDSIIARLQTEADERTAFIDSILEEAEKHARDVNPQEMALVRSAQTRLGEIGEQMGPLQEAARIARDSRARHATLAVETSGRPVHDPATLYRTAGAYAIDSWRAALGEEDARERLMTFRRAAAHQTTSDNLGVVPEPIVGSVLNFIDSSRPIVSALGPLPIPSGRFTRPRVTQHTDVAAQASEKTELVSRKMLISSIQVLMATYGGYVNISRQNIDWSVPSIMDLVVQDLAAQYAIETEQATANALETAATAGPTIPTGPATPEAIAGAIWTAAGTVWTNMQGAGRLILAVPPDMLGMLGPLFAPVNPTNAQGSGFSAAAYGTGAVGTLSGIPVYMSTALTAGSMLLVNTASTEVYEQRIGTLSVTEPSVLGVQVAYAGYFAPIVLEPGGIVEITKTP